MFDWQRDSRDAMVLMVSKNRDYIEETSRVLTSIHSDYLESVPNRYSSEELDWIDHFLHTVIFKYFLASIAIEQLQTVKFGRLDESLLPAIENSLARLDCSEDETVLVSFALESFLFEARAFLDVYMIFICLLLKTGFSKGRMSKQSFYDELEGVSDTDLKEKATWVKMYFEERVFGEPEPYGKAVFRDDWGSFLRSLRDRVAHRDRLLLSFESTERLGKEILLDWPTLNTITYHTLAETIGNEMHSLFHKVLCHIYERDWDEYQQASKSYGR